MSSFRGTLLALLASVQVDNICKQVQASNTGYMYKDKLATSILALVDDMVGITEAGYKAQQMNAIINTRSAEKRLQFGVQKCKIMIIGNTDSVMNSNLQVDSWNVRYNMKEETNNYLFEETYNGKIQIDKTENQKYLGFFLSSRGNNMVNIKEMEKKSIWVSKRIFNRLQGLNLKQYYFQCGLLFLNIILRSSILYASETYYNLKENELRTLERIEEKFIRKLLKTSRGCPISQIYLETGHIPARFEIYRRRCLFFKDILDGNPESMIYKFIMVQHKHPTRGDWVSSCLRDLRYLDINFSLEEIQVLKKTEFRKILKQSIEKKALEYLLEKRGSKGCEIQYSSMKMAEYLSPTYEQLSLNDQRYIFAIRNRMIELEHNFRKQLPEEKSICGDQMTQQHI